MNSVVNNAISHLKDLEQTMRNNDSSFSLGDIDNCDQLAVLLEQLENQVKGVHDELEIETIKVNVLRHQLSKFDFDFKKELEESIKGARDSNKAVILSLKAKLDALTQNLEKLHKRDQSLTDEIDRLQPERNELEEKHHEIMAELNKHMANKAIAQIKLNETRDVLRDRNQAALDLEDEMITLKECLINEREEARAEKARLEEERVTKNKNASIRENLNIDKLKEVEVSKRKLEDSNMSLKMNFRDNERLEQINAQLMDDIERNNEQLNNQQKRLEACVLESLRLTSLNAKIDQDYAQTKDDTLKKTKETIERTQSEGERLKMLKEEQDQKREGLKNVYDTYNQLQIEVAELKKKIETMKIEIGNKLKEIAEHESKSEKLLKELASVQETYTQVMESLQREAEELKEQVNYERELRVKKQLEKENLKRELDAFNTDLVEYQAMVKRYYSDSKDKNDFLKNREDELNRQLEHNKSVVERLKKELDTALNNYNLMKLSLENKLKKIEEEILGYANENEKCLQELNQLNPGYTELCKTYADKVRDYEEVRRNLISAKSKKVNLEGLISQTKEKTKDHKNSREDVKEKLAEKRQIGLELMQKQNQEKKALENFILHVGIKVQAVKKQNDRFVKAIKEIEQEYKLLDFIVVDEIQNKDALQNEYEKIHSQLLEGWKEDAQIEQEFYSHDSILIENLAHLKEKARTREIKVDRIGGHMSSELNYLNTYFHKMVTQKKEEKNE